MWHWAPSISRKSSGSNGSPSASKNVFRASLEGAHAKFNAPGAAASANSPSVVTGTISTAPSFERASRDQTNIEKDATITSRRVRTRMVLAAFRYESLKKVIFLGESQMDLRPLII